MLLIKLGLLFSLAGIVVLAWASKRVIDSLKLGIAGVETTQLGHSLPITP